MRLRDRIEERAARKFQAMEFEGTPHYVAQYRLQNVVSRGVSKRDAQRDIRNSIENACAMGLHKSRRRPFAGPCLRAITSGHQRRNIQQGPDAMPICDGLARTRQFERVTS